MSKVTPEKRREYQQRYYQKHRERIRIAANLRRKGKSHWNNPEKEREWRKQRRKKNRDRLNAQRKLRNSLKPLGAKGNWNPEKMRVYNREYYWANRTKLRAYYSAWQKKNRDKISAYHKARRLQIRDELIAAYGGCCQCCGERDPVFLTLDHTLGNGHEERKRLTSHLYASLKKRGWPKDGYRLLCMNCNWAIRNGDECPHQARKKLQIA